MAIEIERKFLVKGESWQEGEPGVRFSQGYLASDPDRTVRVRLAGERAWLTIKGRSEGIRRAEFEYEIPVEEAAELLELCLPTVIDKTRYRREIGDFVWEIDVFHGENEGLVLAEVELPDEHTDFELPKWAGAEVSDDPRYFNSMLSRNPYREWKSPE
ncbi:MAG: CYTH domain-containing protein [Luteolibacter sp.]